MALTASAMVPFRFSLADGATRLRAEPCTVQVLPPGEAMSRMLGFNGTTPGQELRVVQGEQLSFTLENGLTEGTAVHSHGIHLPNEMDGVPELTQPLVEPGGSFQYSYVPQHAGTYWYHSHNRSWEQVAKGLYGPLIVEEIDPPLVNRDITVVLDDWRIQESGKFTRILAICMTFLIAGDWEISHGH